MCVSVCTYVCPRLPTCAHMHECVYVFSIVEYRVHPTASRPEDSHTDSVDAEREADGLLLVEVSTQPHGCSWSKAYMVKDHEDGLVYVPLQDPRRPGF